MEAYFDGLRVFQSPDNDIMVIRDERPVMHIACTKQLMPFSPSAISSSVPLGLMSMG